jgi:orotate phosphoribosyltransferase
MAKAAIYTGLFDTKTITVKEFITHGERTYTTNISRVMSNPALFDNITLLLENLIRTKSLEYDRICATSVSAIPFATNIATSVEKPIAWVVDNGNDRAQKGNIAGLKVEGGIEIDDRVLLIETIASADFYLENIITRIRKFGGRVVGVLVVLNVCEGEYVNLLAEKEPIYPLLNLFDIMTYLENNNLIELFYSEKIKFFCEKETKLNLKKLLSEVQQSSKYDTNA